MLYSYIGLALIAGVILSEIFILIISHKLAGPLVRLRNHFEEIGKTGEPKPLSFREGDFFSDLPPVINNALKEIDKKHKKSD